jgi:xylose isomerase
MLPFAFEPKDEEPFYKMYFGSAAWALECCWRMAVEFPLLAKYLGLNIEVCHSRLGKADSSADYGQALEAGKLFHTHENGGLGAGFDEDRAAGDDNRLEMVERMWHLKVAGYKGLLGMDVQPLPTDRDEQAAATVARSVKGLKWAVAKARKLDDASIFELQSKHDEAGILDYVNYVVFGN